LINALPGSAENEENPVHRIVKVAETESQQTALLVNVLLLADELIPRSSSRTLSQGTSQSTVKQAESFALLLKRHTFGFICCCRKLKVTAECVQLCASHCSSLESRGLALCPVLLEHFRPGVEKALTGNLKSLVPFM